MRIIGGHDYYDNFVQYGVDNNIILLRNSDKYDQITLADELFEIYSGHTKSIYIKNRKGLVTNITRYETDFSGIKISCGFVTVIIGENAYNGLILIDRDSPSYKININYVWDLKSLNKYLSKFDYTHVWNPANYYSDGIEKEYFISGKIHPSVTNFMIKNEISIITGLKSYKSRNFSWQFNYSNLNDLEFFKKQNGHEVYQELSHWIGNTLLISKQMPDITDDKIKIHKHGFDKWSFRKKP
ncbi:MAG: hypothetical protein NTZ20_05405 [Candidatus Levybacteria bacterium]|nr:hypothetical protein [Candidatus Levybacteria bacterium]